MFFFFASSFKALGDEGINKLQAKKINKKLEKDEK